jgi:hypothetical protein
MPSETAATELISFILYNFRPKTSQRRDICLCAGIAYIGTACKSAGDECSVIEDFGDFSSNFTAAHELGHG